ncbi:MAG: glycine cleavage system aminomethyltransferase GcvT [Rhodocyclaceae bacterium]|nr:glycine cleavage system aminomethyltransferase GcvT [Pseudomonadota bacterium]MDQ7971561.1 glycine cleavage system aminomethyltransferase GcvT [Rhodocyclaceae bacterium]MDQ7999832.1 glycine cleavage system aminomethyltransferase GcvT [Pseudomonadota bacterium]MDQ8019830.1 glycine cleavage system aminomethyltransferase GcvT [Pseudomonadota bacterium]
MASSADTTATELRHTPLHALHLELGGRMVPFAGYSMPVQYPAGLMAEHRHTRTAAGLFDISHMGQLRLVGPDAAAALETLMPVDVIGLAPGKQRYGLLLNDEGGIVDDLMFFNEGHDSLFVIVNGACKEGDLALIQQKIGHRCQIQPLPDHALLALQGPQAAAVLARLSPGIERFVFMTGGAVKIGDVPAFATRSGYTGEDGFEISVAAADAERLARLLLAQPEVQPIGLGARNSLRLEAGLCLYGNDLDPTTTPVEASLTWAIQKVRRAGGAREGGFPGATKVIAQLAASTGAAGHLDHQTLVRRRVGLVALERVPVREGTVLRNAEGTDVGLVTSGLLGPTVDRPIAMAYVATAYAEPGTRIDAIVRGKAVPMEVTQMPFVPARYFRG